MRSLTLLLVACALLVAACTPKPVVVPLTHKLPIPPTAASARPALAEALQSAAAATAEAERARASVERVKNQAANAQAAAKSSAEEAKRLYEAKTATESELLALYNKLVDMEKNITLMSEDIFIAQKALELEKQLSAATKARVQDAELRVVEKEAENAELRRLLVYSESLTAQATATAQEAVNSAEKLRADVGIQEGRAKTWRNIAAGTGGLLLLALAAHVLRSYMRI